MFCSAIFTVNNGDMWESLITNLSLKTYLILQHRAATNNCFHDQLTVSQYSHVHIEHFKRVCRISCSSYPLVAQVQCK